MSPLIDEQSQNQQDFKDDLAYVEEEIRRNLDPQVLNDRDFGSELFEATATSHPLAMSSDTGNNTNHYGDNYIASHSGEGGQGVGSRGLKGDLSDTSFVQTNVIGASDKERGQTLSNYGSGDQGLRQLSPNTRLAQPSHIMAPHSQHTTLSRSKHAVMQSYQDEATIAALTSNCHIDQASTSPNSLPQHSVINSKNHYRTQQNPIKSNYSGPRQDRYNMPQVTSGHTRGAVSIQNDDYHIFVREDGQKQVNGKHNTYIKPIGGVRVALSAMNMRKKFVAHPQKTQTQRLTRQSAGRRQGAQSNLLFNARQTQSWQQQEYPVRASKSIRESQKRGNLAKAYTGAIGNQVDEHTMQSWQKQDSIVGVRRPNKKNFMQLSRQQRIQALSNSFENVDGFGGGNGLSVTQVSTTNATTTQDHRATQPETNFFLNSGTGPSQQTSEIDLLSQTQKLMQLTSSSTKQQPLGVEAVNYEQAISQSMLSTQERRIHNLQQKITKNRLDAGSYRGMRGKRGQSQAASQRPRTGYSVRSSYTTGGGQRAGGVSAFDLSTRQAGDDQHRRESVPVQKHQGHSRAVNQDILSQMSSSQNMLSDNSKSNAVGQQLSMHDLRGQSSELGRRGVPFRAAGARFPIKPAKLKMVSLQKPANLHPVDHQRRHLEPGGKHQRLLAKNPSVLDDAGRRRLHLNEESSSSLPRVKGNNQAPMIDVEGGADEAIVSLNVATNDMYRHPFGKSRGVGQQPVLATSASGISGLTNGGKSKTGRDGTSAAAAKRQKQLILFTNNNQVKLTSQQNKQRSQATEIQPRPRQMRMQAPGASVNIPSYSRKGRQVKLSKGISISRSVLESQARQAAKRLTQRKLKVEAKRNTEPPIYTSNQVNDFYQNSVLPNENRKAAENRFPTRSSLPCSNITPQPVLQPVNIGYKIDSQKSLLDYSQAQHASCSGQDQVSGRIDGDSYENRGGHVATHTSDGAGFDDLINHGSVVHIATEKDLHQESHPNNGIVLLNDHSGESLGAGHAEGKGHTHSSIAHSYVDKVIQKAEDDMNDQSAKRAEPPSPRQITAPDVGKTSVEYYDTSYLSKQVQQMAEPSHTLGANEGQERQAQAERISQTMPNQKSTIQRSPEPPSSSSSFIRREVALYTEKQKHAKKGEVIRVGKSNNILIKSSLAPQGLVSPKTHGHGSLTRPEHTHQHKFHQHCGTLSASSRTSRDYSKSKLSRSSRNSHLTGTRPKFMTRQGREIQGPLSPQAVSAATTAQKLKNTSTSPSMLTFNELNALARIREQTEHLERGHKGKRLAKSTSQGVGHQSNKPITIRNYQHASIKYTRQSEESEQEKKEEAKVIKKRAVYCDDCRRRTLEKVMSATSRKATSVRDSQAEDASSPRLIETGGFRVNKGSSLKGQKLGSHFNNTVVTSRLGTDINAQLEGSTLSQHSFFNASATARPLKRHNRGALLASESGADFNGGFNSSRMSQRSSSNYKHILNRKFKLSRDLHKYSKELDYGKSERKLAMFSKTLRGKNLAHMMQRADLVHQIEYKWQKEREALKKTDWEDSDLYEAFKDAKASKKPIEQVLNKVAQLKTVTAEKMYTDVELQYFIGLIQKKDCKEDEDIEEIREESRKKIVLQYFNRALYTLQALTKLLKIDFHYDRLFKKYETDYKVDTVLMLMTRARKMYSAIEMILTIIKLLEKLKSIEHPQGTTLNMASSPPDSPMLGRQTGALPKPPRFTANPALVKNLKARIRCHIKSFLAQHTLFPVQFLFGGIDQLSFLKPAIATNLAPGSRLSGESRIINLKVGSAQSQTSSRRKHSRRNHSPTSSTWSKQNNLSQHSSASKFIKPRPTAKTKSPAKSPSKKSSKGNSKKHSRHQSKGKTKNKRTGIKSKSPGRQSVAGGRHGSMDVMSQMSSSTFVRECCRQSRASLKPTDRDLSSRGDLSRRDKPFQN